MTSPDEARRDPPEFSCSLDEKEPEKSVGLLNVGKKRPAFCELGIFKFGPHHDGQVLFVICLRRLKQIQVRDCSFLWVLMFLWFYQGFWGIAYF